MRRVARSGSAPMPGAKATFRALLLEQADRLGLSVAAVEELVAQAQITQWRRGGEIFAPDDEQELSCFLVSGAVRVMCQGSAGRWVAVQTVAPGRFFGAAWFFDGPARRQFRAVAHTPAVVALFSQQAVRRALGGLAPERRLRLVSHTWRILSRLLVERCRLLTQDVDTRLLGALGTLARDFGHAHPRGTLVGLEVTHRDLAELVAAGPSTVRHSLSRLRRQGRIDRVGRHLIVRATAREEDAT